MGVGAWKNFELFYILGFIEVASSEEHWCCDKYTSCKNAEDGYMFIAIF